MSANPTRVDWNGPSPAGAAFPVQEGNRVLESLARREALRALLAFSELRESIRNRRGGGPGAAPDADLFETERFVLDEVLQLICERAMTITHADGVLVALQEGSHFLCRASAGPMAIERQVRLISESEFLQDCLDSGQILRCDDCDVDARVELDLSRQIGARSSVIVPLRGQHSRAGVLQAFSNVPFAFSDDDVRCFDLLGELVLSALRPEDQDRRLNWLTDVVDDVLCPKPVQPASVRRVPEVAGEPEISEPWVPAEPETTIALPPVISDTFPADEPVAEEPRRQEEEIPEPAFLTHAAPDRTPHPGLRLVLAMAAVAALFLAGVWFGMRHHDAEKADATISPAVSAPQPTPDSTAPAVSDHLMEPSRFDTGVSATKLSALPKVTNIRHWSTPMGSTVVIDMQDQAPYEVHRLMSPERIYFDIHDTALAPEFEGKTIDIGDVALSRVRIAQPVAGVTRVVLDTRDGSNFSVSMESNPYRLVVELRGTDRAMASNQPARATDNRTAAALSPLPAKPDENQLAAKGGRIRIALDAGHGGWDLGTVGRNGLQEKDLVLDVTRRLGKLLQARLGSEVIFTRTADVYLPLDERADFANQAQADLFVSVHANYSSAASARGVETYYTNTFTAPGSRDVENPENTTSPPPMPVSISATELHDKIEESRRLAGSIQKSLYSTLAATNPGIRDRGVKDSQFVVLTGTTMPSILTEISFVSSPADERNLQSEAYRQQIAEALYKGIARFAATMPRHVKVAEMQQRSAAAR